MTDAVKHRCNVCGSDDFDIIFKSRSAQGLTSLCQLRPGRVEVSFCRSCGHLGTNALEDVEAFYESDYTILISSVDEDQIYETDGDTVIYRTDHQLRVLQEKQDIVAGMKVLDYGCAKADMARRLKSSIPATDIHLFDVSRMYIPFWEKITDESHWALHETPDNWAGQFDMVMSFFAFEHIPDPAASIAHVASLLKTGGVFYTVIPDAFGNIADFVVSDHVNHFTATSMTCLLSAAGFSNIQIDTDIHRGAMVVRGVKSDQPAVASTPEPAQLAALEAKAKEIAAFWDGVGEVIGKQEAVAEAPAAIYGSGFYGAYIYSQLSHSENVRCFLDKSPYQQGRRLFDVPIVAPSELARETRTLYVGLNPSIARKAMAGMPELSADDRDLVFLT
ncbi:Methyltransferase domain [Hoeflea sp. IMCC20628]|uniref:class I SAM-dependent methyltransferase n=1 Tax=Hoeflea sp. IMCC20628 TaxID=1620421 RepID=UPI00063ABC9A|nr:class I SAM-dependent methyltransferase [Hoeflea sp. IMCC20628]AKI02043.1 Methyltransferase domain [Hoeflea sp. IMCC20628]